MGTKMIPVKEASVILGVSERLLRRNVRKGKIDGQGVGNKCWVSIDESLIDQHSPTPLVAGVDIIDAQKEAQINEYNLRATKAKYEMAKLEHERVITAADMEAADIIQEAREKVETMIAEAKERSIQIQAEVMLARQEVENKEVELDKLRQDVESEGKMLVIKETNLAELAIKLNEQQIQNDAKSNELLKRQQKIDTEVEERVNNLIRVRRYESCDILAKYCGACLLICRLPKDIQQNVKIKRAYMKSRNLL